MLFSVIVPVYNVADYLPKCMDALLRQTCNSWEIILVDDGSTDGRSGALCDEYAAMHPTLVRVIHQDNGGLGAARNAGIAVANGDYLFFVDSDDWIADDTLYRLTQEIEQTHADMYSPFAMCLTTARLLPSQDPPGAIRAYARCRIRRICFWIRPARASESADESCF